jgi:predicted nucleic acid-binding protein
MVVIADTTPLNYLVLIGEQELLPTLFGQVIIPESVLRELQAAATPPAVRQWIASQPPWLVARRISAVPDVSLSHLDEGEREVIQLAVELGADLLLVDERAARKEAASRNLATSGTLGFLDRAAEKGLVDFSQALHQLKQTSFFLSPAVEQFFLDRHARRQTGG